MKKHALTVREIKKEDIDKIIQYWLSCDEKFLLGMGVDLAKMPSHEEWIDLLSAQLTQSYEEKKSYCMIWQVEGKAVGHSNVNKIVFGDHAYMHLHLWETSTRTKGLGTSFVTITLPYFFHNLKFKKVYCEPYALNPSPNKTLMRVGFEFIKEYITIPGMLNFEQSVNLWEMSREKFESIK